MKAVTLLVVVGLAAAGVPWQGPSSGRMAQETSGPSFPGWGAAPFAGALEPLASPDLSAGWVAGFPGKIGVFRSGNETVVVRWVVRPTRSLHPAADCLRGLGYVCEPQPILDFGHGERWGMAVATRGRERVRVRERLVDADGRSLTDTSTWFWEALLGRSRGPWWAVTVIGPPE